MMRKTKNKSNIIIEVDTGIDDALALLFASKVLREEVVGVTTCGGNVTLEHATRNTQSVLSLAGWEIPVYAGASKTTSGSEFVHAYDYHGTNGVCDVTLPRTKAKLGNMSADEFIISQAKKNPIRIICLSAPTNIATALKKDPSIVENIESVYLMGGAINVPGNQTEYAEYNFFQDPFAVKTVLENIERTIIIPLDVTGQALILDREATLLKTDKDKKLSFLKEAVANWYRFFGYPKKRFFELYDPLTIAAVSNPEFFGFIDTKIGISLDGLREGEIFINGKYPVTIATSVQAEKFKKLFFESLS
jgi:purine nucleosidase